MGAKVWDKEWNNQQLHALAQLTLRCKNSRLRLVSTHALFRSCLPLFFAFCLMVVSVLILTIRKTETTKPTTAAIRKKSVVGLGSTLNISIRYTIHAVTVRYTTSDVRCAAQSVLLLLQTNRSIRWAVVFYSFFLFSCFCYLCSLCSFYIRFLKCIFFAISCRGLRSEEEEKTLLA